MWSALPSEASPKQRADCQRTDRAREYIWVNGEHRRHVRSASGDHSGAPDPRDPGSSVPQPQQQAEQEHATDDEPRLLRTDLSEQNEASKNGVTPSNTPAKPPRESTKCAAARNLCLDRARAGCARSVTAGGASRAGGAEGLRLRWTDHSGAPGLIVQGPPRSKRTSEVCFSGAERCANVGFPLVLVASANRRDRGCGGSDPLGQLRLRRVSR